jgi:lysophospholipase L1-like esterase
VLKYPEAHEYINRGIGGDRVVDLYAKIKCNLLNLKPDFLSILIGVNDVWHELGGRCNGVSNEKYFKVYCDIIEEIKAALPDIKILIMEPFCLKGTATEAEWDTFRNEVEKRAASARKVADKYNLGFLPLQKGLDELAEKMPAADVLHDGVHPTYAGHTYISRQWIKAFEEMTE